MQTQQLFLHHFQKIGPWLSYCQSQFKEDYLWKKRKESVENKQDKSEEWEQYKSRKQKQYKSEKWKLQKWKAKHERVGGVCVGEKRLRIC